MEIYILGVFIAFLHKIIDVIFYLLKFNSVSTKNYEKIGLFLDSSGRGYKIYEPPQLKSIIFQILFCLIISPLGSWLTVLSFYIIFIYNKYKKFTMPNNIAEFSKKMNRKILSYDEIHSLMEKYKIK